MTNRHALALAHIGVAVAAFGVAYPLMQLLAHERFGSPAFKPF